MKKRDYIIVLAFVFMGAGTASGWQRKASKATTISSDSTSPELLQYSFRPEIVYPASGNSRQLTAGFELRFSKDSLFCYLPYFGRVYNAAYARDETLHFTTTDFEFIPGKATGKERNLMLKPKGNPEIRDMKITLYPDGYAYVQVMFNQRQNIAYRGQIITEKRP